MSDLFESNSQPLEWLFDHFIEIVERSRRSSICIRASGNFRPKQDAPRLRGS